MCLHGLDSISTGFWLDFSHVDSSKFKASIIATTCWYIWKTRCDYIFKNKSPDYTIGARTVVGHVRDYSVSSAAQKGFQFFYANKPQAGHLHVYVAGNWRSNTGKAGLGFIMIDSNAMVKCVGINQQIVSLQAEATGAALIVALNWASSDTSCLRKIFTSDRNMWCAI